MQSMVNCCVRQTPSTWITLSVDHACLQVASAGKTKSIRNWFMQARRLRGAEHPLNGRVQHAPFSQFTEHISLWFALGVAILSRRQRVVLRPDGSVEGIKIGVWPCESTNTRYRHDPRTFSPSSLSRYPNWLLATTGSRQ